MQTGVLTFEHSSGNSVRGRARISHWANKELKSYLHLAAIQGEGELRSYYQRQVGKDKMLAVASGHHVLVLGHMQVRVSR